MTDTEKIEVFLNSRRHQLALPPIARPALKYLLDRASGAGLLDEILNIRPPVCVMVDIGQAGWTKVMTDLEAPELRIIFVVPRKDERKDNAFSLCAVIAHEMGHAFHGHRGAATLEDECAADAKVKDWRCGEFLKADLTKDRDATADESLKRQLDDRIARL